jgi:hypothetical protein
MKKLCNDTLNRGRFGEHWIIELVAPAYFLSKIQRSHMIRAHPQNSYTANTLSTKNRLGKQSQLY